MPEDHRAMLQDGIVTDQDVSHTSGHRDDHSAQMSVAALAYPEQFRFTARGVFSRTEPGCHIARLSELSGGSRRYQKGGPVGDRVIARTAAGPRRRLSSPR